MIPHHQQAMEMAEMAASHAQNPRVSQLAAKIDRRAGVPVTTVRHDGTVHDFMLLNPLAETDATRAAIAQATAILRAALGTD
jgi:acetyl esterase/lipase